PVGGDDVGGGVLQPAVDLGGEPGVLGHACAQRQQGGAGAHAQFAVFVLGRGDDHAAHRAPRGLDEVLHFVAFDEVLLQPFHAPAGVGVGLELGGEVGEEGVEGAACRVFGHVAHLGGEAHEFLVDAFADLAVDEARGPAGRAALDGVHDGVAVFGEPVVG